MGYRWRGFEHPELYDMINSGPGSAASEPQTQYWRSLTDELTQVDEALNSQLKTIGASWEGEAAERAQTGLTPLAEWATDAETASSVMRISSENQADYISTARSNMPEPVAVTTPAPSGWQMAAAGLGAVTGNPGPAVAVAMQAADHEAQEAAQSEAQQKAVQTMQNYESSSTWNRDTLGTFVTPPDVVVSTPPPQGGTAGVVTGPESQAGPNAGGSTQASSAGGTATIPTGSGGAGPSTLTPIGAGGGATPPAGGQPIPGAGVSAPPAITTPSGLVPPPGQPPVGGPPVQPGPGIPPVSPTNPGPANGQLLPPFGTNGNTNPTTGGTGPLNPANRGPLGPGGVQPVPGNAGDVARRGLPVRGGLPGGGGLGPGGFGPGGVGGAGADTTRGASPYGRAPGGGAVPGGSVAGRQGPGAASAAGGRGAAVTGGRGGVAGPMGAGGRRADDEDDAERYAPDYLLETEDVFGDDRRVAPTVIGESTPQE